MTTSRLTVLSVFAVVLLFAGYLRYAGFAQTPFSAYSGLVTPIYIGATILAFLALRGTGLNLNALGFAKPFRISHLGLALAGVIAIMGFHVAFAPMLEAALGSPQGAGAERFKDVEGSIPDLIALLARSWTVAALGEEITFRMTLMEGIRKTLGEGVAGAMIALIISALIFGFIHLYQGPMGMIGSVYSGLVFGTVTLIGRGAIWPAFLCHGLANTIGILRIYGAF